MDKFSGESKGFGFVEMATAEEPSKAIQQFNDTQLKGRNIKVSEAKPRENSFGSNRGGGGGDRAATAGRKRSCTKSKPAHAVGTACARGRCRARCRSGN